MALETTFIRHCRYIDDYFKNGSDFHLSLFGDIPNHNREFSFIVYGKIGSL